MAAAANNNNNNNSPAAEDTVEEEVARVVEQAKELQETAASLIAKSSHDEQSLRKKALSLESSVRRCRSLLNRNNRLAPKLLEEDLQKARCIITDGDASAFLPSKPQGRFLKMFLGPINVRASRKDVQLKVKEEYNSYRDRTALLFLLFPSILLCLRSWVWNGCLPTFPVQLYQAWLLFLYTGLALRENILRANGSDIRPWWIYHHYCAMIMALVSLTWDIKGQPNCAQKQGFEAYVGLQLLRTAFKGVTSEWQVIFCGILLVFMAVGNFLNTVQTLMAKSRFKAKMKSKSKQELD
ncbi:transmembrane protein 120 [Populus alba x Populus x berolinensis]|nr:transmembrane protein 120 [Populus alba x Populus x berolinensis]